MQQTQDDRSLGELFAELAREMSRLVQQEIALAKTEMTQKATRVGINVAFLLMGAAIAYAGLLAIIAAIIIALGTYVMPMWAAALVVGLVIAGIAAALVMKGLNALKSEDLAPRQTIETLKEDAQWAKEQIG